MSTKQFTGVVQYADLSGGIWKLITETGVEFVLNLIHDDGQKLTHGQEVTIQGTVGDSFGIGMTSDQTIQVETWVNVTAEPAVSV